MVYAADERRLSRSGWADQTDRLAFSDLEGHAVENVQPAEALVHVVRRYDDARLTVRDAHRTPRAHACTGVHEAAMRSKNESWPTRSFAASLRSIRPWISVQTEVSRRYHQATARKYSTGLNVFE